MTVGADDTNSETAAAGQTRGARGATKILSDILSDLKIAAEEPPVTPDQEPTAHLGAVVDRLDERAFGFLLLMLALPCCLPFVYLLPQIVALPMLALAGQMAAGSHHPWLPKKLHDRDFSIPAFEGVIDRADKYIGWVERFSKPRLLFVTSHLGSRIVGFLMLIPIVSILIPLPSTNTAPGIGIAVASLGLIERDGVLVILGLLFGFAWVFLLLFLGQEAISLIKAWLGMGA
ncbi:exopolysaccharide biosynthesis protein [Hyphococcus formosus]|uniref:exopolysaccharide biosynthesis protein n=1 Tax=Hyphococcus formosus TaxID=3143534 RepID=UPI00398B5E60